MQFIDSHAHIYSDKFSEDRDSIVQESIELGVDKIFMPNIDHESIDPMFELETKYPTNCFSMMGLHPCSVTKDFEKQLYEIEDWLDKRKFAAVGEIGTDLYWDKSLFSYQKEAFKIQCDLALKHNLPIAIHCRESIDETIEILEDQAYQGLKGVFHCFTGTADQAKRIVDLGYYLGIGGVLTFKNAKIDIQLADIEMSSFLLETDSPYLSPAPHRGKRNSPTYIPLIAQKLADVKEVSLEKIAEITSKNSLQLFNAYEL